MSDAVIQVKKLVAAEAARWDEFVESCPQATFFHLSGWRNVVERAFGRQTHYLYAECDGKILGVLPLGHIRSRIFSNMLVSVPYCVYGGVVATRQDAEDALINAAKRLADELRVDYLELRQRESRSLDLHTKELYVTFRKEINEDPEENLKAIPRKQRAMVRKGIKAGLVGEVDSGVERFFEAYSHSVRNLGTPVMPRKWFELVNEEFGDACEILTITKDGRPVSSVMSYYFRDEVLPYYGGGSEEARNLKANDFMYWELMRRACERGIRMFDYGRSKIGTGSYSFKKNWGFEPEPLCYLYYLVASDSVPDVNPLNPKYRLFVNMWRRLPVSVSRFVGPFISRDLA